MDVPYTKLRQAQYRGPSTSDDYNARIEENYKDLVVLYNRVRTSEMDEAEFYRRVTKEQLELARVLADLEGRVATLEAAERRVSFHSADQLDTARFDSTPFAISSTARLHHDLEHGLLLLPRVDTSSLSRLYVSTDQNEDVLPPSLETRVVPDPNSADAGTAIIDTSEPELAVIRRPGRLWERNVAATAPDPDGAELTLYVKVPTDLYTNDKSNVVILHPYPVFAVDLLDLSYTTTVDVVLDDEDGYTPLNTFIEHTGQAEADGWIAPRTGGREVLAAGPRAFYFDPKPITGMRVRMRTTRHVSEAGRYVYTYGLSRVDLRYDKFLGSGRAMIEVTPPAGQTISAVSAVQPEIWNTNQAAWPSVFSWRSVWETSSGSGVYTTTPVANSARVWIEVTLSETPGGGSPALSGLTVTYT